MALLHFSDSVPHVQRPEFSIVPRDSANGPSNCPSHLLIESEDGTVSPVQLISGAFEYFKGDARKWVFFFASHLNHSMIFILWDGQIHQ